MVIKFYYQEEGWENFKLKKRETPSFHEKKTTTTSHPLPLIFKILDSPRRFYKPLTSTPFTISRFHPLGKWIFFVSWKNVGKNMMEARKSIFTLRKSERVFSPFLFFIQKFNLFLIAISPACSLADSCKRPLSLPHKSTHFWRESLLF